MPEPCASTPTTPTTTIPTGFLSRVISRVCPEDPGTLVTLVATVALLLSLVALVVAAVRWIWQHGDLGSGACWALGVAVAGLCVLARVKVPLVFNPVGNPTPGKE